MTPGFAALNLRLSSYEPSGAEILHAYPNSHPTRGARTTGHTGRTFTYRGYRCESDKIRLVWQPNPAQWRIIVLVALLIIFSWPPDQGRSLGVKAINRLADPTHSLAVLPDPLPIGLDDNGDAVAEHDATEAEYYRQYSSSSLTRLRMNLKSATDPLDAATARQILVGIAILAALAIWRLDRKVPGRTGKF
jgi:hypothetical protein